MKNESFYMCGCFLKSLVFFIVLDCTKENFCSSSRLESDTVSSSTVKLPRNLLINLNHYSKMMEHLLCSNCPLKI